MKQPAVLQRAAQLPLDSAVHIGFTGGWSGQLEHTHITNPAAGESGDRVVLHSGRDATGTVADLLDALAAADSNADVYVAAGLPIGMRPLAEIWFDPDTAKVVAEPVLYVTDRQEPSEHARAETRAAFRATRAAAQQLPDGARDEILDVLTRWE